MTQPPDWVTNTPSTPAIHNIPAGAFQPTGLSADQQKITRDKFNEQILQIMTLALKGVYIPTGTIGSSEAQIHDWATGLEDTANNAQSAVITLANLSNAPKNVSYWESPNPFEDVSFPRSSLIKVPPQDTGSSSTGSSGAHTHPIPGSIYIDPIVNIPDGMLTLVPIRAKADRTYNTAGFITNGASPPTTVYMGIYTINLTTGVMTLEYDFGNISTEIDTGAGSLVDTRVNTNVDIQAAAGDIRILGILPVGGALTVLGVRKTTMVIPVFPKYATALWTGQTTLPSTIPEATPTDSTHRIWCCLGQALPVDESPITLIESFQYSDTISFSSSSWTNYVHNTVGNNSQRLGIRSGRLYVDDNGNFPSEVTFGTILHRTRMHTNDHASEITIGSEFHRAFFFTGTTRAYVRCLGNGSVGVCMHLDGSNSIDLILRITTVAGPTDYGTIQTTVANIAWVVGDKFTLAVSGNEYRCYQNNIAIPGAVWTDTGNIIPQTSAYRTVGCGTGMARDSTFDSRDDAADIEAWRGYDLA